MSLCSCSSWHRSKYFLSSCGLVTCFVGLCHLMDLLVTMHFMLCGLQGTGVSTAGRAVAPMTLKYTFEYADDGCGICKDGFASDDAPHVIFPSIVGGYNMPGIMFGMDQKDSNSSDEVQIKRCNVTAVADDASCLFGDLEIDPIIAVPSWSGVSG